MRFELINGTRISPALEPVSNRCLRVGAAGRIESLDGSPPAAQPAGGGELHRFELTEDTVIFPGLINAHDHLVGTFQPRVGQGPYRNWLEWDRDLKNSGTFEERNKIDFDTVYHLGAMKCILSGVTTVADHIPHHLNDPHIHGLPVRVPDQYCLAHSVASFRLDWGDGHRVEYERAVERDLPFMIHVAEGFDEESLAELAVLDGMGCLGPHTVLVHGVGFSADDVGLVAGRGAHLAWCPGSNQFMFGATTDVKALLEAGVPVSLGTDSLLSGPGGLFDEIQLARRVFRERYSEELTAEMLLRMVTVNPARALRLDGDLGTLEVGKFGDLLCMSGRPGDENQVARLLSARPADIQLLTRAGTPLLAEERFEPLFRAAGKPFSRIILTRDENGDGERGHARRVRTRLITGNPEALLEEVSSRLGYRKELPFFTIDSAGTGN